MAAAAAARADGVGGEVRVTRAEGDERESDGVERKRVFWSKLVCSSVFQGCGCGLACLILVLVCSSVFHFRVCQTWDRRVLFCHVPPCTMHQTHPYRP